MSYSSQCLGCSKYFMHAPDETTEEQAYCDACLKSLKLAPRGYWNEFNKVVEDMLEAS